MTTAAKEPDAKTERGLARVAQSLAGWTEKWFPDAYVVALAGVVLVSVAALANGSSPQTVVDAFGGGFWDLTAFTLQMAMVVLTGYVVATSPPVARLIDRLATLPASARTAVSLVAFLSMTVSFLMPAFGILWGYLFLDETITLPMLAGAALIVAGTAGVVRSRATLRQASS